jgi:hypothetical protein
MSLATSNRDGGRTSESGHLRAIQKVIQGEVLTGLTPSQRGAGANMSIDIAIGDAVIPRSDGTYGHPAWNDAVYNQVISAADVSNPRRDIVVMYIDYSQTPSTGVSNNTNGVVKIKVVNGTPAGSPSDPSDSAIQSSVGASNPWIKLARVRVAAGASSITNSVIDDQRVMANGLDNGGWQQVPNSQAASWAFSSFNSATRIGVFTVPTDATTRYSPGQKVRVYQATGGWKYGFIVAVTSTTVSVFFNLSITLNNEAVLLPAISYHHVPAGYTGPQLVKEMWSSFTGGSVTNSERWVYEISGWRAIQFTGTAPYITLAVAYGMTFASAPAPIVGFGGDSGNVAFALGTGGNTINGTTVSKAYGVGTTGFSIAGGSSNSNYANGNVVYLHYLARGPVS